MAAKTRASGQFWLALVIFSLVGQVAWVVENMYFNVFLYKMFHASASDISLMVGPAIGAAVLKNAATVLNDDGTTSFIPNANIFLAAFVAGIAIWLVLFGLFRMLKKEENG